MKIIGKSVIIRFVELCVIIVLMVFLMNIYSKILAARDLSYEEEKRLQKLQNIFFSLENIYGYIDEFTIYGNNLNIKGYIEGLENKDNINLVIMDIDKNELIYDLNISSKEEKIMFNLSENINEGINLDEIKSGEYYIFLKQSLDENNAKYISLKNITSYGNSKYYTTSSNNLNNVVDINFTNFENKECVQIISNNTTLPDDVYDIVIDAGHGGRDAGAISKDVQEKEYTLKIALALKEKLESLGYKVNMTRDKDEYVAPYGPGGRALIPYESKAKLFLSIHLNSTPKEEIEGGLEIYAPNKCDLKFAKTLADNIISIAGAKYSANNQFKIFDGVYVKNYTQKDVEEAVEYANDLGYTPYESLSTQTPYYFMIRETGGIMTKAYMDGRNKESGSNPYYNSNIASEAYLLELGFVNSTKDMKNIIENLDLYIQAISETIVNNYN